MIILANFGKWEKLSSHDHHRDNGDDDDDHHDDGLSGNQWLKPARHSPLISATCFQSPACLPLSDRGSEANEGEALKASQ